MDTKVTTKQLKEELKDITKVFDEDIRALKKTYLQKIASLQKQVDESAARKVRSSLRT